MNSKSISAFSLMVLLLAACNLNFSNPPTSSPTILPTTLPFPSDIPPAVALTDISTSTPATPLSINQYILDLSSHVVQNLSSQDFVTLSGYVHPVQGLRFSPYAFVKDTDQVFSAGQIAAILADSSIDIWGSYSGSGEPINLSFPEYYSRFIYDQDFANAPQVALNHRLSTGNSIDNSTEFFPGSMSVEYYFPGFDPQYGGMDWRSLRLVFSEHLGAWYLVGIIHDEWTP